MLFDDDADVTWPRISPDGKALLYISFERAAGQLCIRRLPDGESRRCLDDPSAALQAEWIDRDHIALVSRQSIQGNLRVLLVTVEAKLYARALLDRKPHESDRLAGWPLAGLPPGRTHGRARGTRVRGARGAKARSGAPGGSRGAIRAQNSTPTGVTCPAAVPSPSVPSSLMPPAGRRWLDCWGEQRRGRARRRHDDRPPRRLTSPASLRASRREGTARPARYLSGEVRPLPALVARLFADQGSYPREDD
jgi:hypothetical protein